MAYHAVTSEMSFMKIYTANMSSGFILLISLCMYMNQTQSATLNIALRRLCTERKFTFNELQERACNFTQHEPNTAKGNFSQPDFPSTFNPPVAMEIEIYCLDIRFQTLPSTRRIIIGLRVICQRQSLTSAGKCNFTSRGILPSWNESFRKALVCIKKSQ